MLATKVRASAKVDRRRWLEELVSEGDIDVAKGIFDKLGHFGRARISRDAFAFHEPFVEGERLPCATRRNSADRPIVMR